jgi:hypothetical protein
LDNSWKRTTRAIKQWARHHQGGGHGKAEPGTEFCSEA